MIEQNERQVKLDKIKFTVLTTLPEEFLDVKMDTSQYEKFITDRIVIRVRGFIWGENLKEQTIMFPRDWWQALKERWFPNWLLQYSPVVYTVHHINAAILYPGLRPSIPNRPWRVDIDTFSDEKAHD